MVFSGDISLDGGGFSSIRRSFSSKDLSGHAGVVIEVDAIVTGNGASMAAPQGVTLQMDQKAAAFAVPVAGASGRATIFLPFSGLTCMLWNNVQRNLTHLCVCCTLLQPSATSSTAGLLGPWTRQASRQWMFTSSISLGPSPSPSGASSPLRTVQIPTPCPSWTCPMRRWRR